MFVFPTCGLYCGITSGQCKTLQHYLTTYVTPNTACDDDQMLSSTSNDHTAVVHSNIVHQGTASIAPAISHPYHPSLTIPSYYSVAAPTQTICSRYPSTPSRDHQPCITSYPQPFHPPFAYQQQQQQQQLVQYPPLSTNPLLSRSHDIIPVLYPITMYRHTASHLHNQMYISQAPAKDSYYGNCM